jgi:phosphoribosylglycinamide formyltransferase 1
VKNRTKRVVFLCSAGGSTMKFLHFARQAAGTRYEVAAVISDRRSAALDFAKRHGIPARQVDYSAERPRELRSALAAHEPDVIITNFYRLLDPGTVRLYRGKLVNLHYSLLPSFKGFRAVRTAVEMGCKFVGTTAHLVNDEVDGGRMISQCAVPIYEKTAGKQLMTVIFRAGCLNLLNALEVHGGAKALPASVLPVAGRSVFFNPGLKLPLARFGARFWRRISEDGK